MCARLAGNLVRMGLSKIVLVGKFLRAPPLGRQIKTREDNIKSNLWQKDYKYGKWIELIEDCVHWRSSVLAVLNLRVLLQDGQIHNQIIIIHNSPKRWHLPTSLHGAKTQNIIILTAVKTSDLYNNSIQFFMLVFCTNTQMANYRYSTKKERKWTNYNKNYIIILIIMTVTKLHLEPITLL
jgi:hypothetical protein